MPNPGDQHRATNALATNPFEEHKRPISGYTAQEIATLQSRLNKRLGPEFVSTRPGPGNQKIAYLSAEKAINLANEVFGFNGWSSSIQQIDVDFVEENPNTGKVSLGLSVIVRVTLKDGTFHEDIGYGGIENCKGKAMAFEKSKKEATTDALKRALRNFGNVLGNCMYDRNFVAQVSKVKVGTGNKFDVNDLHRHPDFAPKGEPNTVPQQLIIAPPPNTERLSSVPASGFEDSFDIGEFDDVDFDEGDLGRPDEVLIPIDHVAHGPKGGALGSHGITTPSKLHQHRQASSLSANLRGPAQHIPGKNASLQRSVGGMPRPGVQHLQRTDRETTLSAEQVEMGKRMRPSYVPDSADQKVTNGNGADPDLGAESANYIRQQAISGQSSYPVLADANGPVGFYSAKATQIIDPNNIGNLPSTTARFNPHAESPSIRKTAGVDHTRSVPVKRDSLRPEGAGSPKEFIDPKIDTNRRIGMPGNPGLSTVRAGPTSSAYRPPTRQGSPGGNVAVGERPSTLVKRPPLVDISNGNHNVTAVTGDGTDAKRQRTAGTKPLVEGRLANGTEKTAF